MRRQGPRCCRTAEERNELATLQVIELHLPALAQDSSIAGLGKDQAGARCAARF